MTTLKSKSHPDQKDNGTIYEYPLPEGLYVQLRAVCHGCGRDYDFHGYPEEFNYDLSYCGRTSRCVP